MWAMFLSVAALLCVPVAAQDTSLLLQTGVSQDPEDQALSLVKVKKTEVQQQQVQQAESDLYSGPSYLRPVIGRPTEGDVTSPSWKAGVDAGVAVLLKGGASTKASQAAAWAATMAGTVEEQRSAAEKLGLEEGWWAAQVDADMQSQGVATGDIEKEKDDILEKVVRLAWSSPLQWDIARDKARGERREPSALPPVDAQGVAPEYQAAVLMNVMKAEEKVAVEEAKKQKEKAEREQHAAEKAALQVKEEEAAAAAAFAKKKADEAAHSRAADSADKPKGKKGKHAHKKHHKKKEATKEGGLMASGKEEKNAKKKAKKEARRAKRQAKKAARIAKKVQK